MVMASPAQVGEYCPEAIQSCTEHSALTAAAAQEPLMGMEPIVGFPTVRTRSDILISASKRLIRDSHDLQHGPGASKSPKIAQISQTRFSKKRVLPIFAGRSCTKRELKIVASDDGRWASGRIPERFVSHIEPPRARPRHTMGDVADTDSPPGPSLSYPG